MRVVNSYFENLGVAEVLRTEHCYVTLTGQHEVNKIYINAIYAMSSNSISTTYNKISWE